MLKMPDNDYILVPVNIGKAEPYHIPCPHSEISQKAEDTKDTFPRLCIGIDAGEQLGDFLFGITKKQLVAGILADEGGTFSAR